MLSNNNNHNLNSNDMIAKSNIKTTLSKNGQRVLQNRKNLAALNFSTEKVAAKNARKYSELLSQKVWVIKGAVSFMLATDNCIL